MITRRFLVRGRVQGVGFRWFVARQAQRLGVNGLARNLDDGSVEVVAQGSESAVAMLAESLARGPSHAQVTQVENADAPPNIGTLTSFETL